jgi:hypothetical protein
MADRRQVARQGPIEVEVLDGTVYEAHALPWLERNDLGAEILQQYQEVTNSAIKAYVDPDGVPQLDLLLNDKLKDPVKVLKLAYPHVEDGAFDKLTWPEILELIYAACDINGHGNLRPLIDPNFPTPTSNGGKSSSGMGEVLADILKTQSTQDSDSLDSPEEEPSDSPTMNSMPSLTNGNSNDGQSDTGDSP